MQDQDCPWQAMNEVHIFPLHWELQVTILLRIIFHQVIIITVRLYMLSITDKGAHNIGPQMLTSGKDITLEFQSIIDLLSIIIPWKPQWPIISWRLQCTVDETLHVSPITIRKCLTFVPFTSNEFLWTRSCRAGPLILAPTGLRPKKIGQILQVDGLQIKVFLQETVHFFIVVNLPPPTERTTMIFIWHLLPVACHRGHLHHCFRRLSLLLTRNREYRCSSVQHEWNFWKWSTRWCDFSGGGVTGGGISTFVKFFYFLLPCLLPARAVLFYISRMFSYLLLFRVLRFDEWWIIVMRRSGLIPHDVGWELYLMFIEHLDFIPIAELGDSRSLSQPVDCYFLPSLFNPCASANIPIRLYVELWLWSMQHSCLQAHLLFCMLRCVACGLLSKFVGRLSAGFFPRSVFRHLQSQPYFNQSQRVPTLHILLFFFVKGDVIYCCFMHLLFCFRWPSRKGLHNCSIKNHGGRHVSSVCP